MTPCEFKRFQSLVFAFIAVIVLSAMFSVTGYTQENKSGIVYPLGGGWSVEHKTPQTVCEMVQVGDPITQELKTIPAVYRWVKADAADSPETVTELVTTPAVYMDVTEKVITVAERKDIIITAPTYNDDGSLRSPAVFEQKIIPPKFEMRTRRVVKTPARTDERIVPIKILNGYKRVVVVPAMTVEDRNAGEREKKSAA